MKIIAVAYLSLCLLTCSCATMLNSDLKRVDIITNRPAKVIVNNSQPLVYINRTKNLIPRDISPLKVIVFNDTLFKEIIVDSRNSAAYWLNIYPGMGLGMVVDKDRKRRFSYPGRIYIDMTDTLSRYWKYDPWFSEGEIYLKLSLPHINSFLLKPSGESNKASLGFWGAGIGLDYYHHMNRFFNLSGIAVMDFFLPFPAAVDLSGEYDLMSSVYVSFSDNYRINRFSLGYGVSLAKNIWDHRYYAQWDPPPPERDPVKLVSYSLGLVFPFYVSTGEYFSLGLVYRPTVYTFSPEKKSCYEHLVSIDFAWKIPLKR